ncbi:DUF4383 domain-containing protein [Kibdelosporangium philippinense]|uniref:DUF4383 domain-containing protein n=1 Tax=Kibdelosporangium philippinense TaxID=211113 RepID=A0ABS8ZUC3_9PSEU|nr:DUF4383 domain-containing protein [Kibdelosporangium philippinense]MCE7011184.1 DUF4383 domain-containing protein [Kibdelosporangium philippinense]
MSARTIIRLLVGAIGVFYCVLAVSGFASLSDDTNVGGGLRGGNDPDLLWGLFGVNTVLGFIHFLLGALTFITAFTADRSRLMPGTMAGAFGVLFVYDLISLLAIDGTDPLAINTADLWLHGITAVVLVLTLVPARRTQGDRRQRQSLRSG